MLNFSTSGLRAFSLSLFLFLSCSLTCYVLTQASNRIIATLLNAKHVISQFVFSMLFNPNFLSQSVCAFFSSLYSFLVRFFAIFWCHFPLAFTVTSGANVWTTVELLTFSITAKVNSADNQHSQTIVVFVSYWIVVFQNLHFYFQYFCVFLFDQTLGLTCRFDRFEQTKKSHSKTQPL